jgi:hypothetical protein
METWTCKEHDKAMVQQTKGNKTSYFYLYPFRDLAQGSFQRGSYVCIK